jgi:hypothetical protein
MSRLRPKSVVFVFTLAAGLACETNPVDVGSGSGTQLETSQAVVAASVGKAARVADAALWEAIEPPA